MRGGRERDEEMGRRKKMERRKGRRKERDGEKERGRKRRRGGVYECVTLVTSISVIC